MGSSKLQKKASTYIATVAHELKNPLSAIFGYADILLDTPIGDGLTERQKEIIERIRATATKSVDLVKNYQFLAVLDESKPNNNVQSDLTAVITSVYETLWRDSEKSPHIELKLLGRPLPIHGRTMHVERVVSNLFSNALKYTPHGETITIKTALKAERILFEVHNTGALIDPEDVQHLFDMYTRGKGSNESPGAGIGLYIVKTICDAINATLSVESSPDLGTTFQVLFKSAISYTPPRQGQSD